MCTFDICYEIFVGDVREWMADFKRKFRRDASLSQKRGMAYKTVEGNAKRFSGCRLQIPRSSWRNLHTEELWQLTPPRPPLSSYLISFIAIVRFSSVLCIFLSFHRFPRVHVSLLFFLVPCVPNDILVRAYPLLIHEECGINKAASGGKTINPERRASNLLNGKRKREWERKEEAREKSIGEKRVQEEEGQREKSEGQLRRARSKSWRVIYEGEHYVIWAINNVIIMVSRGLSRE